ncbi:MAG: DNA-3-methyladenine glycosylase, partial [Verrucomicrobiota bacterium]
LRRAPRGPRAPQPNTKVSLAFRPPFDWNALLAFLRTRAVPGVEAIDDGCYRRTFATAGGAGVYQVALAPVGRALDLAVRGAEPVALLDIVSRVRRQFDLDADPMAIAAALGGTTLLAARVRARPGMRVPGAWDRFETLVRAVLGQQISVAAATTLCGRLVRLCGTPVSVEAPLTHVFPTPAQVAAADLTAVGLPRFRAESLRGLAAAVAGDPALLEPAPSLDSLIERLCALPGVGPWTAQYAAMRAFNEPDAFPAGDLILRRAAGDVSARALERLSQAWRPWRAYAALHLWTQHARGDAT